MQHDRDARNPPGKHDVEHDTAQQKQQSAQGVEEAENPGSRHKRDVKAHAHAGTPWEAQAKKRSQYMTISSVLLLWTRPHVPTLHLLMGD